ncbi:MAG: hypothetical protein JNL34_08580 [Anaerolineae bacterium]|nr:hypothetical protein [Anaerolineae bacterium]
MRQLSRTRYIIQAIGRVLLALTLLALMLVVVSITMAAYGYLKATDTAAWLVLCAIVLILGTPWLAAELISDLGPFPPKRYRTPWRLRLRLNRLYHAARRHRVRRRAKQRADRITSRLVRADARAVLTSPTLATRLDILTTADLTKVCTTPAPAFGADYARTLAGLHTTATHRVTLDATELTEAARVLFLPVLLGIDNGTAYDRLDHTRSNPATGTFVYTSVGRAPDLATWQRHAPTIAALLGNRVQITSADGLAITVQRAPDLPPAFPLTSDLLQRNALFLGRDLATGHPHHLPLTELTHTLVVGPSGFGKSTFLHQLVVQLALAATSVETVYLVDLKHGLELAPYATGVAQFNVVEHYADLPAMLATLHQTLASRIADVKASGDTQWRAKPILIVVDEFAEVMLEPDSEKNRKAIVDGFVRLGNQARAAGMHLWVQTQYAVADTLPTALRRNLTATMAFRQPSAQAAAQLFGDTGDFPVDITRLARGQLLYRNGRTSELTALQAAYVTAADLARLR